MARNVDDFLTDDEHQAKNHAGIPGVGGGGDSVPIGTIVPFGAPIASISPGWLPCDGSEYDQTVEAVLFAVIGTTWNTGGETGGFFRVPDFRGRSPLGLNDGTLPEINAPASGLTTRNLAQKSGSENTNHTHSAGSFTAASAGDHSHTVTISKDPGTFLETNLGATYPGNDGLNGRHTHNASSGTTGAHGHSVTGTSAADNSNNMQPFVVAAYIIKANNIGGGTGGVSGQVAAGPLQGPQPTLNFINGSNITVGVTENIGQNRLDITISSSAAPLFEFIEKKEITVAATDVTFAGLDGDTDKLYMMVYHYVPGTAAVQEIQLQPNGLTTNQSARQVQFGATYVQALTNRWNMANGSVPAGPHCSGILYVWARRTGPGATTIRRSFMASWTISSDGFRTSGEWTDSGPNLTSLNIHSLVTSGIGIGSTFTLYKMPTVF
jgi:microcystin-dependent protein